MFAPDDRAGNVLTTVALFAAGAAAAYAARATLVVLVLALLLAYLLDPMVAWVQRLLPVGSHSRTSAIALVYVAATLSVAGIGLAVAPAALAQFRRLNASFPELLTRFADRSVLAAHASSIASMTVRLGPAVAVATEDLGWLLMVPVIAVFLLGNRAALLSGIVNLFARHQDRASVTRTLDHVDAMLAQYIRAQLALAGLSAVLYSISMVLLGFPFPLALGVLGGALEFVPVVGWIMASALMLTVGWLAGAQWIWMAGIIVIWRVALNFVISPRIMGDRLNMEPLSVILALMVGSQIGGLLGVILSVPLVAVLRIVWLERSSLEKVGPSSRDARKV